MTGYLKFNLPEDTEEFENAQGGGRFKAVIGEIDNFIRLKLKHGHEYKSADEALADVRRELRESLDSMDVRMD